MIDQEDNSTYIITGTSLRQNFYYFSIYKVYCKIAIDVFAYIMIIVLNTFIVVKLVKSSKFRKNVAKNEGTAKRNTENETFLDAHVVSRKSSSNSRTATRTSSDEAEVLDTEKKLRKETGKGLYDTKAPRC